MAPLSRDDRSRVSKFWAKNYLYNKSDTQNLNQKEVYALFKILYPETSADLAGFMQRSGTIGVKSNKKKKWFFATPITDIAERHHKLRKNSEGRGVSFHLVNIRGLITQKHNKVEILNKFADMSKPRRIMAIIETHLCSVRIKYI